jgi:hypothetical protein
VQCKNNVMLDYYVNKPAWFLCANDETFDIDGSDVDPEWFSDPPLIGPGHGHWTKETSPREKKAFDGSTSDGRFM